MDCYECLESKVLKRSFADTRAMSGQDGVAQSASAQLAPIEIKRLENIERNNRLLNALGIQASPKNAVSSNTSPAKV